MLFKMNVEQKFFRDQKNTKNSLPLSAKPTQAKQFYHSNHMSSAPVCAELTKHADLLRGGSAFTGGANERKTTYLRHLKIA